MKEKALKEIENVILILCVLLAVFVRFYKLAEIPYGIHVDEAAMGYDAWCIANYGVDRWLNAYPVYLINFGGGQNVLSTYLCAFLLKLTGSDATLLMMRLPSAIVSTVAYIAGIYMIWKILSKHWAVIASFLLAILPYFVMQSRFALESSLLVNMLTISVCLLLVALEKGKTRHFVIAGISWGITYYTYAISYIPNTIILLIACGYLLWVDRSLWKKLAALLIPVALLGLPLLLMVLVNQFEWETIALPFMTIPRLPNYRGSEIGFELEKMLDNVSVVLKSIFMRDGLDYNAFSGYYTLFTISIPFVVLGFLSLHRYSMEVSEKRKYHPAQLWWLIFVVYFVFCLGLSDPNVNRVNGIFFAVFFALIWGIREVYFWLARRWKLLANVILGLVLALYVSNGASFLNFYFEKYPTAIYPQFLFFDTYEETLEHLEQEGKLEGTNIYIESSYVHYCLSTDIDPYEFDTAGHEETTFQNFTFGYPEEYEPGAVYIVRDSNIAFIEVLEQYVTEQFREGMYVCYY